MKALGLYEKSELVLAERRFSYRSSHGLSSAQARESRRCLCVCVCVCVFVLALVRQHGQALELYQEPVMVCAVGCLT